MQGARPDTKASFVFFRKRSERRANLRLASREGRRVLPPAILL